MKKLLLIIIFILNYNSQAQINTLQLNNESEIQNGIDYKNKNYYVFENSNKYYKKSFYLKTWESIKYKFNQLPPTKNSFPYNYFHVDGKNILVDKGCGEVFEFRNDSIIKIDNSFQHKNQFSSCTFVYNNEIYYFGGYGLFTFKNILTKFDFKTKEWELIKYSNYPKIPEPRQNALSFVRNNFLYVISGISEDYETKQTTGSSKKLNDIWKLNLQSKTWEYIGELNSGKELLYNFNGNNTYQSNNQLIYDNSRLFEFDFENNKIKYSEPKDKYLLSFNEQYNLENNEIIYGIKNTDATNTLTKIIVESFKNYQGENYKTYPLIKVNSIKMFGIVTAILTILLFFIFYWKRTSTKVEKNCVIFKENAFFYKNKILTNLTFDENKLLKFFFNNFEKSLQMNEVVDLFSQTEDKTYSTLTKKKDSVLGNLKQKLAFILDINETELFIYKKNKEDKRIREIQLNPQYFAK